MFSKKNKRVPGKAEALEKLQRYCVYQDRCHKEVRTKLLDLGLRGMDVEEVIIALIEDKFLDEERFARSYARGKFRMKKWGKMRIRKELKFKQVSEYCIKKGMTEIDDEEYYETIVGLLEKKNATLKEPNSYKRKNKLATFVIGKGFESFLVWEAVNELKL